MSTAREHVLINRYFEEFEASAQSLEPHHRRAIEDGLRAHLAETLAPDASDDEVADALEELGTPAQILAGEVQAVPARNQVRALTVIWLIVVIIGWILVSVNALQMAVGAILNLSGSQFPPGWYWIGMFIGLALGGGFLLLGYWGRRRTRER
jgi:hypothetical protein